MPQRGIDTGLWSHPDVQRLSVEAKLLYIYLWSNSHCNQAGLYRISSRTIAFDTGLHEEKLPDFFHELRMLDVDWYNGNEVIWVKKFLKHQAHSPQFLVSVAKCLESFFDKELVRAFLAFNNTLSIPYQYPINTLEGSTVSVSDTDTVSDNKSLFSGSLFSLVEVNKVLRKDQARAEPFEVASQGTTPVIVDITSAERELLGILRSVKGYPFNYEKDLGYIRQLAVDFPKEDLLSKAKKWVTYKLDKPLMPSANARSQFRNWVEDKQGYDKLSEKKARGRHPADRVPDKYTHPEELDAADHDV